MAIMVIAVVSTAVTWDSVLITVLPTTLSATFEDADNVAVGL